MKKLLLPLLALLFLISCEKESMTDLQPDQEIEENGSVTLPSPAPTIEVCHYDAENDTWQVINISENAWPAHAGHGDVQLIDEDGDGYVTSANECGLPVDCDDTDAELTDNCSTSCVEGELEVQIDPDGNPNTGDEYTLYVYPQDNSSSIPWSNSYSNTGATDNWDGDANTDAIVMDQGADNTYAAPLCASLKTDGCDWYLPARNELHAMYQQLGPNGSGEMPSVFYWSSTEFSNFGAWGQDFNDGVQNHVLKSFNFNGRCRCVRR